ncbi:MAG: hypothetical protein A3H57_00040 [Candidatus Taylorbacteria bacterium RIFCSPLOWO2_02_FULL_43_11]|uniref:Uncharacterized protein n=1 Tax=Candidatus Taylorbacteria bacterium RIFCSPHIGHO2_02_FULL_43_32b TaxID=1802306 RepID=A0A1G2MK06_9BACT|nr:MAG: hypothetical protein A2743_02300 [Candidatus Taylorbacteria bacterium RIFCSPHIGHO2_01_FULL_43_47]OHA24186.1 MAG: hypothetical protein A3C72_03565 [Candidatus Taylorbacteria bacterium RIFCSPHIGHO2_02_FULL_43_32b]OHA31234.1 MAG: hypothetical protein A3B08_00670 [Candidatus Taylorbacteria bacterium RIFCSPLOWO2_01_FULL_43_44]OHA37641.1 MAG: hypothetical protein A3H57_00040 [Candidatus Taylorbacteria bacterium RIFCSPLOWO2_02_FULL_43_11]
MAIVISIGNDRLIFEEGSKVRNRMIEYGTLFDELHIVVLTQGKKNKEIQISKNVWVYPTNSWSRWLYPFDASSLAKRIHHSRFAFRKEPFIVSAQDPFESGLGAYWASRKIKAKLHIQVHTDFLSPFFKKGSILNLIRIRIANKILAHADGIRVVSKRIFDSIAGKYSLPIGRVSILPIYVADEKKDIMAYDFKKDFPDWTFVVLMVGRLEKEKNLPLAFRVLKEVIKKYPKTGMVIVGEGRQKGRLELLAELLRINKNISFIGRVNDPTPFYLGADAYLHTSNFEGFGMSLVEALKNKLPIVTTDVGVSGWLLKDGENALLCGVGDSRQLYFALMRLIEDNGLRERLKIGSPLTKDIISLSKSDYLLRYQKDLLRCLESEK